MTRMPKVERKVEYLPYEGEVKATNDAQGIVEGYLNRTNVIDFGDDRSISGCFKRTITDSYARKAQQSLDYLFPYLWNHSYDILPPGGIFEANEDKNGLYIKTRLNLDIQLGREIYASFKSGFLRKQSMGYRAIKYEYVKEDGRNIRNLLEVAVVEGSCVIFPMNDLSAVDVVKSVYVPGWSEAKGSASGKTSWPLADRGTKWDAGQAKKDIEAWAGDDKGKMAQCFFWVAKNPPETLSDCKLPFVANVGGEMKAIPQGIFSCAGVIQGAMGGADIDHVDAVKAKIARYYKKLDMSPPWKDGGKGGEMNGQRKDFNATYQERMQSDWLDDLWNLWFSLRSEIINAFRIGDQPVEDVQAALDQFSQAMIAYVQQGVDLGMVEALQPDEDDNSPVYGYMSGDPGAETKEGRMISTANHAMMTKAVDGIMEHCKSMNNLLQAAKPQKSLGADDGLPQQDEQKEAPQDDAVSTHLGDLLASIQLANIGRQLKLK